jgi:hypothetical protein
MPLPLSLRQRILHTFSTPLQPAPQQQLDSALLPSRLWRAIAPLMRTLSLEPYSSTSHPSRNRFQNPASAVQSIANYYIAPIALQFGFLLRRVRRDRLQFIIR